MLYGHGKMLTRVCDEGLAKMNPNPDYDASDELEYGIAAYAWLLRGVYPPPSYAPDLGNAGG
jgi:hypothetical protein